VRRKGSCMPTDVLSGPLLRDVDWRASLQLNVVLQTSFSLTVSTCGHGTTQTQNLTPDPDRNLWVLCMPALAASAREAALRARIAHVQDVAVGRWISPTMG